MTKIAITGLTGFIGSHLAEYCLNKGDNVSGTVLSHHLGDELQRIEHIKDKIDLKECNLMDRIAVARVFQTLKPDKIYHLAAKLTNPNVDKVFHLAAQSFVPTSWKSPEDTLLNNIMSELNVFEVIKDLGLDPVIVIACSSEEYGLVKKNELPIKETNPLRPVSPYAVSKVAQENLAYQYHKSYGYSIH